MSDERGNTWTFLRKDGFMEQVSAEVIDTIAESAKAWLANRVLRWIASAEENGELPSDIIEELKDQMANVAGGDNGGA